MARPPKFNEAIKALARESLRAGRTCEETAAEIQRQTGESPSARWVGGIKAEMQKGKRGVTAARPAPVTPAARVPAAPQDDDGCDGDVVLALVSMRPAMLAVLQTPEHLGRLAQFLAVAAHDADDDFDERPAAAELLRKAAAWVEAEDGEVEE
jgi:hypothetical protein